MRNTDSVVSQPHQAAGAKGGTGVCRRHFFVNDKEVWGCLTRGNFGKPLVDTSLVSPGDYTGETMTCSGVFDGRVSRREVPLAIIKL